jgi:hypothetical protein
MSPEERLSIIASDLREGKPSPTVTVREFLSWFGALRRGYWIVRSIRQGLAATGLQTSPHFESAYIDSPISLVLAGDVQAEPQQTSSQLFVPLLIPIVRSNKWLI